MTKTTTLNQANKVRAAAEAKHAEAVTAITDAETKAVELGTRNRSGDDSITALDLLAADAEIGRSRGLAAAAASVLADARASEGKLLADKVADEVASKFTPPLVDEEVERVHKVVTDALCDLVRVLRERDEASDQAGRTLAAAGVPMRERVGRVRYNGVYTDSGKTIPGKFNLSIDGAVITRRSGHNHTAKEGQRLTEGVLTTALKANGLRWGTYGVEDAR